MLLCFFLEFLHSVYLFVPPGHSDATRLLLSKGVPVDPFYHHGTPLHLAAGNGHDQALKILLEHGAGVSN